MSMILRHLLLIVLIGLFLSVFSSRSFGDSQYIPVQYNSFDNKSYNLFAVTGKNIALLVDSDVYDINVISKFVDKLDLAYDFYKKTTGRAPEAYKTYNNLLTIAVVDSTCGLGCGLLGYTGIETLKDYFQLTYQSIRDQDLYESALFYELGRNFWFYFDQIGTQIDPFVTGFAVVNRYLAMEYAGVQGTTFYGDNASFVSLKNNILNNMSYLYFKDPNLDWTNTLATNTPPPNPYNLDCVCLVASLYYRIYSDFGADVYSKFFNALSVLPLAKTKQVAIDNFTTAYQTATGTSHGCSLFKTNFKIYANDGSIAKYTIDDDNMPSAYYGYSGDVAITTFNPKADIFAGSGNNSIILFGSTGGGERIISCGPGIENVHLKNANNNSQSIKYFLCENILLSNNAQTSIDAMLLLLNK